MSRDRPANLAASVHQRLLNLAAARGDDFNLILTRYGIERLLYRLGHTPGGQQLVLKGAVLFYLWDGVPHRPTRDIDFLGYGDSSVEAVAALFRSICAAVVEPDGLRFQAEAVRAEPIRDHQEYGGVRVRLAALLGTARVPLQVDIGFGDAVVPGPVPATFPTLLDFPAPRISAYPVESVVAEKLYAIVTLGEANTRMKDFYDVWFLAHRQTFDGARLAHAIAATFTRRGTVLPTEQPLGLSGAFSQLPAKQREWRAFLTASRLTAAPDDLVTIVADISRFLLSPLEATARAEVFDRHWTPAAGWRRGGQ